MRSSPPLPLPLLLLLPFTLFASLAAAHYRLDYPYWRQNSLEDPYDQWVYPCAGVNQSISSTNRTLWPLTGGSLSLRLSHANTPYIFVNLALGSNVTNFNISLIGAPNPLNVSGNGTFCLPRVAIPVGLVTEGQNASIQVITPGERGSALYNCADITFSSAARILEGDACVNSTGVTGARAAGTADGQSGGHSHSENGTAASGAAASSTSGAAASSSSAASAATETYQRTGLLSSWAFAGAVALALSRVL